MKKKSIISIIALIFLFSCVGNQRKNSLSESNVNGKVKILTTFQYKASEKFGQAQKDDLEFTFTEFYNEHGYILEKSINHNYTGFDVIEKVIYEYDEQGNSIGKHYVNRGDLSMTCKYSYDKKGNLIEYHEYNSDGKRMEKIVTQYNKNGEKLISYEYDSNDSIERIKTYSYEEKGKKMIVKQDKSDFISIFTYDDNGNEISLSSVNESKGIHKLEYQSQYDNFDEKNNWTKKIRSRGKVDKIYERKIQYYDNVEVNSKRRSSGKKLNQENAERTIKQFVSENSFEGGRNNRGEKTSFSENSISSIEEIRQFTDSEASSIVQFDYHDDFADGNLVLKFIFKKDINKHWFLTSIENVSGVGSQGMADRIYKWKNINVPVQ